jgi:hypothetical protein
MNFHATDFTDSATALPPNQVFSGARILRAVLVIRLKPRRTADTTGLKFVQPGFFTETEVSNAPSNRRMRDVRNSRTYSFCARFDAVSDAW